MCIGLRTLTAALDYHQSLADKKNTFVDSRIRAHHQMNFATVLVFDSVVSRSYLSHRPDTTRVYWWSGDENKRLLAANQK